MCGRYLFEDITTDALLKAAKKKYDEETLNQIAVSEVYPSCKAFVSFQDPKDHKLKSTVMYWGYDLNGKAVINARSETALSSNYFSKSLPCAVPAGGYYEWNEKKERYLFRCETVPFYFGGLCIYDEKIQMYRYVILTEEAKGDCALIHHRQPVIFSRENAKKWSSTGNPILFNESEKIRTFVKA